MTRWKIKPTTFEEREKDYTAGFQCINTETNAVVDLTIRQDLAKPASDLIGACQAMAQLLLKAATPEDDETPARMH
jgi:hypothetical protein